MPHCPPLGFPTPKLATNQMLWPYFPLPCSSPYMSHLQELYHDHCGETWAGGAHTEHMGSCTKVPKISALGRNHGDCLAGGSAPQASCRCPAFPGLILSTPWGGMAGPTLELGNPISIYNWIGFRTHQPLQEAACFGAPNPFSLFLPEGSSPTPPACSLSQRPALPTATVTRSLSPPSPPGRSASVLRPNSWHFPVTSAPIILAVAPLARLDEEMTQISPPSPFHACFLSQHLLGLSQRL